MTTSSSRAHSPRRLAATAAVAVVALGGCSGTGMDAQTNAQYQSGVGANVRTGSIQLYNALAVDNGDGTATFSASILNRDETAVKLTGATAKSADGSDVDVTTAPAIVGPGKVFNAGKAAAVLLAGKHVAAGDYVKVSLKFNHGRSVTVDAPVVARTAVYDDVASGPGGEAPTKATPTVTNPTGASAAPTAGATTGATAGR
ncbi:MAG: hypothetical protein ACJ71Z_04990 [Aeromicrobium sp.]